MYYCKHGSFDNIDKCNFYNDILSYFDKSNYSDMLDFLYSVVGYSTTGSYKLSDVVEERKTFCYSSNKPTYIEALRNKYGLSNRSELSEFLSDIGALGIQKRTINTIGNCTKLNVARSFLNKDNCTLLILVSDYLDYSGFCKFNTYQLKVLCTTNPNVQELLEQTDISFDSFLTVKFIDDMEQPCIKDGVLYCKPTGETEEKTRDYLVTLYLYGMPKLPLYLRSTFIAAIPKLVYFSLIDDVLLDILDITYLTGYTVDQLLNIFGYSLPDPEEMFNISGGFFSVIKDTVFYTKGNSKLLLEIPKQEFLDLLNSDKLLSLDFNQYYNMSKIKDMNIFGGGV